MVEVGKRRTEYRLIRKKSIVKMAAYSVLICLCPIDSFRHETSGYSLTAFEVPIKSALMTIDLDSPQYESRLKLHSVSDVKE